ncbi:SusC/RagA family TonB-linked outer membrane protein [uncultured Draconibacterium sp.]|uniref:SusC/RagA family TonB-linked outer membrane protein n=1 Tax=uncultured Draconibacterium sp. TaxID=1573823 RepID=UPI0029C09B42|nr:SusC/RagA family TonB-linked outer membrane protein [uncultured Draconibacterium sp.]
MQNFKSYSSALLRPVSQILNGMDRTLKLLFIFCIPILLFSGHAYAQNINVSGRVTDQNKQPLPGVNVVLKESPSIGTITEANGRYFLENVPSGAILSFSFIGFKTLEIPVNERSLVDVQLQEDITTLSEVTVNAGYYTVKDQERTGSIARVRSKELENQPVSNALSSVQGRMAGVNITQSSGVPGGGYNIQIRGTNSLRRDGNYPLYIIDGVPATLQSPSALGGTIIPYGEIDPLNAINPNDIESIEILKDADATAIYGSRGANGVILVTTKKGKTGSRTALSINSSYGVSQIARKMKLMDTPQYLEMRRQAYANDGTTDYPANAYDINGTWDENRYTDFQEELIGNTATNSMLQFSLNGGGNNSRFLISGSHNEQTSVFSDDFKYKTDNISGNFSHHSSDNRFMLNASGLFSNQSNNLIQTEITSQALRLSPNAPALYQEDGSLNWENNTFNNPLAAYESTYSYKSKTFNSDLNLQYEVLPSLYIKANGGISYTSFEEIMLRPNTMYNPAYGLTPDFSQAFKNLNQNFSWIVEPQLNYRHTFNNHDIDVLVGGTLQQTQRTSLNIMGYGFESNALITNLAAAANVMVTGDDKTEYRYAALFGRINYKYKERYILNLTGRRDGSSRFGPDQRFASFGAIGGAWIFSKEYFLASSGWLSFGKLRASYGITGSDLIGDYQFLDTYTVSNTLYGGKTSLYPSRLNNPYFSWEKTTKLEAAIELGFLKDRIQFSTAWYRNRSGNQLVGIPLPGTTGFSTIQANLPAKVENKGLEFELNTTPVQTEHFNWNSSFNISFPDNKLISFPGLEGSTYSNQYVIGYPTSIIKVYNYEGIDPETGLYQFTDYNDDGNITSPDDNQVIEDIAVKYFGGWSNQISYRQWEFSFLFQFVNQRQKNYISMMPRPGSMYNQPVEVLDVWSEENPDGKYMPYSSGTNSQINRLHGYLSNSNAAVSDASFIRLKNIQLAYQLQINKYLQSARFYVQGQNLLTISDYFGLDPEFSLSGYLPPLKTWSFGIQLNF